MTIMYFDLLHLICVLGVLFESYKFWSEGKHKTAIGLCFAAIALGFISPPLVNETPTSSRFISQQELVEKVEVETKSFEDKQQEKFDKLKKESKLVEES